MALQVLLIWLHFGSVTIRLYEYTQNTGLQVIFSLWEVAVDCCKFL